MSEVEHIIYYRGQRCPLTNQLCQEGYCRGCEIYKTKQLGINVMPIIRAIGIYFVIRGLIKHMRENK
jgi:hypothetical protein